MKSYTFAAAAEVHITVKAKNVGEALEKAEALRPRDQTLSDGGEGEIYLTIFESNLELED